MDSTAADARAAVPRSAPTGGQQVVGVGHVMVDEARIWQQEGGINREGNTRTGLGGFQGAEVGSSPALAGGEASG